MSSGAPIRLDKLQVLLSEAGVRWHLDYKAQTASTNDDARAFAAQSDASPAIFLTDYQTKGRGTQRRRWQAPACSSLLLSVLLPVAQAIRAPVELTQLGALALANGLRRATVLDVRIKWPNDAVVGGRKIGGVLAEVFGEQPSRAVVGMGANLNFRARELRDLETPATSVLEETGSPCGREAVACAVLAEMARLLRLVDRRGAIAEEWESLSALTGELVAVQTQRETVRGRVQGFGPEGELILLTPEGAERRFRSGRVRMGSSGNPDEPVHRL